VGARWVFLSDPIVSLVLLGQKERESKALNLFEQKGLQPSLMEKCQIEFFLLVLV
jgi:hypothetical protein